MSSNDKIKTLFDWCINQTKDYKNVNIKNFTTSWRNGLGFCAILHRYGPEYINYESLKAENIYENCQIAFHIGEKYFGIPALLNARDMVFLKSPDRLSIITYLLQYYATLTHRRPKISNVIGKSPLENNSDNRQIEDKIHSDDDESSAKEEQLICEICSKMIYFLEKLSVSDKYYHRSCYRETQLSNLKARNKTLERPVLQTENQSNIDVVERKSRLHSLSPEAREKIALKHVNNSPRNHRSRSSSPEVNSPLSLDDENKSNNESECTNVRQRLRSLSPYSNAVRVPSFDGRLDMSPSKSLHQFSTDRSSPSASSTHYISVNASSTDSVPKSVLGTVDKSQCDLSNKLPVKLYPGSLNTSSSSLNSSFAKKRRAPPPPVVPLIRNAVPLKSIATKMVYPEDLNPFAEFEEKKDLDNETNPFASYMTDTCSEVPPIVNKKTNGKPKKRLAPKLPPTEVHDNIVNITTSINESNQNLVLTVTSESESDLLPGVPESSEKDNISQSNLAPSKQVSEISSESTSSMQIEIKNENTQTSESVKEPDPVPRTIHLLEKCKSNDSLHLLSSSRNNRQKPPAPSRPIPQKREVRGDTTHEFIPYECLYSDLEEVNRQQSELENKGRSLQDSLKEVTEKDERYETLLQEWLDIVEKKNAIYSKEHHLHEVLRRQELEDRHSDLEYELRVLMGKQESLKTASEKAREEELINQILDTVNARAQLVEEDDETPDKSATADRNKKKSTLKKIFSSKHRSNSLGKTIFSFKAHKKSDKL